MARGTANINWPWRWLVGDQTPGSFEVPNSVQPVLDVAHRWPIRSQQFTDAALIAPSVTTVLVIPSPPVGFHRVYHSMTYDVNGLLGVVQVTAQVFVATGGTTHTFMQHNTAAVLLSSAMPIINSRIDATTGLHQPSARPYLYLNDTDIATVGIVAGVGAPGTEVINLKGLFVEYEQSQPLPFMT